MFLVYFIWADHEEGDEDLVFGTVEEEEPAAHRGSFVRWPTEGSSQPRARGLQGHVVRKWQGPSRVAGLGRRGGLDRQTGARHSARPLEHICLQARTCFPHKRDGGTRDCGRPGGALSAVEAPQQSDRMGPQNWAWVAAQPRGRPFLLKQPKHRRPAAGHLRVRRTCLSQGVDQRPISGCRCTRPTSKSF